MEMKMTFQDFEGVLLSDGSYSLKEIRHLFNAVKEMNNRSRLWVIKWILRGELPQDEVEGITADFLIHEHQFKPMNAFIILNWLQEDPQSAKYFLTRQPGNDPSEEIGQDMLDYLQTHNVEPKELLNCELDTDVIE